MPKLTIIVPIYNGAEYLSRCIESILEQTYKDFELILIDDGSTDGSLTICYEYKEIDNRIIVFHKENEGLVAARKTGLSIASGEYIGFVDCDDYIDCNMYSDLMEGLYEQKVDIVVGGIIADYPGKSVKAYNLFEDGIYDKNALQNIIIPKMIVHSGFIRYGIIPGVVVKVFSRELLEKALNCVPNNISIGEDMAITSYCMMQAESLEIVHSAAYHYIQGSDSMLRSYDNKRFQKICELYKCLGNIENNAYRGQLSLYMSYLLFFVITECIQKSNYNKKKMRRTIELMLQHPMSRIALKDADISSIGFKNKIKIFLMRYKMVRCLMILL